MDKLQKTIFILFAILFFFVPLVLWPYTSEVFEFNKMVLVYALTALITGAWLVRMILTSRIIFRRTILDTPLLFFIGSQLISTILSIDPLTSWLGYYSRFNGGLISTICYSLLYWAFVSNLTKRYTLNAIFCLLVSATLVSIYGVLEHFGIDKSLWVQDVQSRVFSTLGQPNWLAAYLVALMPLVWSDAITNYQLPIFKQYQNSKYTAKGHEIITNYKFIIYFSLSILFFWTFIFTKSRSGYLGFGIAFLIFWAGYFWINRKVYKTLLKPFAIIISPLIVICLISGTQWTPSINSLMTQYHCDISHFKCAMSKSANKQIKIQPQGGTALETGGTESGTIRKIVWSGAIQVFLHYPIFGTGVETFAFSYYKFRPIEHNITSEWDFIYNKAHNEFLNVAANTGLIGLISYLILIGFTIFQISKSEFLISNQIPSSKLGISKNYLDQLGQLEINNLRIALAAGYVSILATNFFGFSVVPTQILFFLFPAMAVACSWQDVVGTNENIKNKLGGIQKFSIGCILLATCYLLLTTYRYWNADTLYSKGKAYNSIQRPDIATEYLVEAVKLEPNQSLFHIELANSYKTLALAFDQQKDNNNTKKFTDLALTESSKASGLSPANINLKRSLFGVYITLATINPNFIVDSQNVLLSAISLAPTDAKLYYNLALVYARTGQIDQALSTLKRTIELKANYKDARLAYALLLIDKKQNAEAKTQLEYILTKIDPKDSLTKQTLEGIR